MPEPEGISTKVDCKGVFSCAVQAVTDFLGGGSDKKATLSVDPKQPGLAGQAADALGNRGKQLDAQMQKAGL